MANLSMLCGNVGIEGGGVNLLRMQSNEQGASDMGGHPRFLPGYQPVASAEARARFIEGWGVSRIPARPGLGMREILEAAARKEIRCLYILGANPVKNAPDTNLVKKALNNLAFLVVHDLFMTETAQLADVVLPAACFAEKNGTFTNTERRVQRVRKALEPPDQAKSEWRILAALARQMGYPMDYKTPSDIFDEMAQLTPLYGGMNYWRIEQNGLQWPCPSLDHPGTRVLHREEFPRGKGVFHAVDWMIRKGL
jgi:predicted molibdopterin-dependent oxidoreductase YjgC